MTEIKTWILEHDWDIILSVMGAGLWVWFLVFRRRVGRELGFRKEWEKKRKLFRRLFGG